MPKISITQAKKLLYEMKIVDIFASQVTNKIDADLDKLKITKQLRRSIYKAEKHFNIDDMLFQLELLKLEQKYYDPDNTVFYYKYDIPEEIQTETFHIWQDVTKSITELEAKIKEISEHIYIQV